MGLLDGKVAIVTGAGHGIGRGHALELARQGAKVVVNDLGGSVRGEGAGRAADETVALIEKEGGTAVSNFGDVSNYEQAAELIKQAVDTFGKLDILINNAGILLDTFPGPNRTSSTTRDLLMKTFETNVLAPVALTQALLPLLKKSDAGRIVNLSSILGSLTLHATKGSPIYNAKTFAYDTSKAALNSFTIHLAHELADTKIKVNSAHPGWVKTDMGSEAATMEIPDGAKTSVWLATLPDDGPTGGFFHMQDALPW